MDVVIQKEALLSTLFSDNVVIITEWDWTRLGNPIVLFDFWQMFCIWALHIKSEVIVTLR